MCTTRGQTSPGPLLASIRSGPAFSLRAAGPKHLYTICALAARWICIPFFNILSMMIWDAFNMGLETIFIIQCA